MYRKKGVLFLCLFCWGAFFAGPLWGEEATEKDPVVELEALIVTANKIEEDVQDVPQSITVMDESALEEKGITDIPDVISNVPNMSVETGSAGKNAINFRGLNASVFTESNPVVIYIDGVPIMDRYGFDASLANVERVEVLRGPQGTLYGKDAIGGVINIITKTPGNEWHAMAGVEYGSYNYLQGVFNLNGPLVQDKLFMGINGKFQQDDGWIENTNPGLDSTGNEYDEQRFGGYLLYKPTDRFAMRLNLSMDNTSESWRDAYSIPSGDIDDLNRDDAENVNFDMPTETDIDSFSQSLHMSYAFDAMALTSTTTHRKQEIEGVYDSDFNAGNAYDGLKQFDCSEMDLYTQEIRLASNNKSGMRWLGGLYFDTSDRKQGPYGMEFPYIDGYGNNYGNFVMDAHSKTDSATYAIFAQAMIPVGDRFEATFGGRYQHIHKEIGLDMYYLPVGITGPAYFSFSGDKDWDVFLPKAALDYRMNDNWNAYISYSQGYMPGGFNYFATSGTEEDNSFDPQRSSNYEVGIKGSLNRLRVAASLFYMDIEDIHIYKNLGNGVYITDNADSAHSQGVELELAYQITRAIELTGAIGLIDAEYDSYDIGNGILYDGQNIEGTPSYTTNIGVSYIHPDGWYGRADLKAVGETSFYDTRNNEFIEADTYITVDAKMGYQTGNWDFYVFGKNLADEEYITKISVGDSQTTAYFGDPLTIGAGIKYRF